MRITELTGRGLTQGGGGLRGTQERVAPAPGLTDRLTEPDLIRLGRMLCALEGFNVPAAKRTFPALRNLSDNQLGGYLAAMRRNPHLRASITYY